MVELREVRKTFANTVAVDRLDLDIPTSGVVALIGPSGCGKSTVLRMIAGLESPDQGDIRVRDRAIDTLTLPQRADFIGYVIQDGGLFPHLTARQNALLPAVHGPRSTRPPRSEANVRLARLAELVHLTREQLDRYPGELSGGQRQRVALVRALILDPPVLLLDEPLGALDPVIRANLQAELRALFAELGKAVVLVTHDLAEAAYLADDIVLMDHGRIAQRGPFEALVREPANDFVRTFVGEQIERVRALLDGAAA